MDVSIILVLAATMFIKKACSQTLSILPQCFSNGDTLTLTCETNDVSDIISFLLNGGNQGGCLANGGGCGTGTGITQSGTTTTKIISFNDLSHSGSWTCTYGSSASDPKSIAENPCVETTEGITEGPVDNECGWCLIECDVDIHCIILLIIVSALLLGFIITVVLYCCGWVCFEGGVILCCIIYCIKCSCKENSTRDPESNNTSSLYHLCCTRGDKFSEQRFTCLPPNGVSDNGVSDDIPIEYNPSLNTGRNMNAAQPYPPIGESHRNNLSQ